MTPDDVRLTAQLVVARRVSRHTEKPLRYFKDRTTVDPETACWLWRLSVNRDGYGQFKHGRNWTHVEAVLS